MIIHSVTGDDPLELRSLIDSAPRGTGAIEVRLDAMGQTNRATLNMLFERGPHPLIATCRRERDGGAFRKGESERIGVLRSAIDAGASFVDLEHGTEALSLAAESVDRKTGVIVSHHDREAMPADPIRLYREMATVPGTTHVKIVGTAHHPNDLLEVKQLLAGCSGRKPHLISFAMGPAGQVSRLLALSWGSWATYGSVARGRESAPGQTTTQELITPYNVGEITGETRLTGIIGTPLGHTLSPLIHNEAYRSAGLDFRYLPFEITHRDDLATLRGVVERLRIRGLSVTLPWKVQVMKHLDDVEPLARRIEAVNTILWDGHRLLGFNTDASGGKSAMIEKLRELGLRLEELRVAIVGAGGGARALAHALSEAGARLLIATRSPAKGKALAKRVGGEQTTPDHLSRHKYDVLVNATPVGMPGGPPEEHMPVPVGAVKGALVYDIVYGPRVTPLLAEAERKGIPTLDGSSMLLHQALQQYELFTGMNAPVDLMRSVLVEATRPRKGG